MNVTLDDAACLGGDCSEKNAGNVMMEKCEECNVKMISVDDLPSDVLPCSSLSCVEI